MGQRRGVGRCDGCGDATAGGTRRETTATRGDGDGDIGAARQRRGNGDGNGSAAAARGSERRWDARGDGTVARGHGRRDGDATARGSGRPGARRAGQRRGLG
uniref:Uncharacterized protein n=1 Tax=Oryza sativa subsp. japonica TaxID=39947 RepID=Q6YST8_ORYSJ|nr:hypothetical protein [Oryza sativa Japonica Group]